MNIPGTRKQPSVSPPGQVPGHTQIRQPQQFISRGPSQPINIRSQTTEFEAAHQVHYPRFSSPRFSASPTATFAQVGSSPHQHFAQPNQQQLLGQQSLQILPPENTHIAHPVYVPVAGQPQHSQNSQSDGSPRPHTLPVSQVTYTTQGQPGVFQPTAAPTVGYSGPPPQPNQQPHQQINTFAQQQTRYQQVYQPNQRPPTPQGTDVQVNSAQVLISPAYSQPPVTHDLSKVSLPQRGQTPPLSTINSSIMYTSQQPRQPNPQSFAVPQQRTMAGTRPTRPTMPVNVTNQAGMFTNPHAQYYINSPMAPQVLLPQGTGQMQVQYQAAGQRLQTFQVNPATQYSQGFYNPNQIYIGQQTHWQATQTRVPTTQATQHQAYQKRPKNALKIIDPNSGEEVIPSAIGTAPGVRNSSTPPQTGSSSSQNNQMNSSTPLFNKDNSIAAQFATQVIATLSVDAKSMNQGPSAPVDQMIQPPGHGVQPQMIPPVQIVQAPVQGHPHAVQVVMPPQSLPAQRIAVPVHVATVSPMPMQHVVLKPDAPQPGPPQAPVPSMLQQAAVEQSTPQAAIIELAAESTPHVIATNPFAVSVQGVQAQSQSEVKSSSTTWVESEPRVSKPTVSKETKKAVEAPVSKEASPPKDAIPAQKEAAPAPEQKTEPAEIPQKSESVVVSVDTDVAPTMKSAPLPQRDQDGKERRKKGGKNKKDLNARGEGGDMDDYTPDKPQKEDPSPPSVEEVKPVSEAPTKTEPEPAPVVEKEPEIELEQNSEEIKTPEQAPELKQTDEELKRVAERNEKNSKEHSKAEEPVNEEPTATSPDYVEKSDAPKDEPSEKSAQKKIELKYTYKEDQWSPLNPEGKMHYDRSFLLALQFASESLEKPSNLPPLPDIVLESPLLGRNEKQIGSQSSTNSRNIEFTPTYVLQSFGKPPPPVRRGGRNSGTRNSAQGRDPRDGGHKVINIQLGHDVKLHQTENAWKPDHVVRKSNPEQDELEEHLKKVRSILNKLTPQNFQKLLQQVIDLGFTTEAKLVETIGVIFEKAISEPIFSVAYANLCKCLSALKVPSDKNQNEMVVFRKVLLNRCQQEFQRDKADMLDLEQMQKEIDATSNPDDKKKLTQVMEFAELKARRRSLGNIRFIGELFKLQMLLPKIMHDCVEQLLKAKDEDSIEALCRLLTTIGKDLDRDEPVIQKNMDGYFKQLNAIVEAKKFSSRIRFMILDAIDLRKTKWVPRHDDNNPKTIAEIHREAHEEEHKKKVMLSNVTLEPRPQQRRGGVGGRNSQQGSHQQEDGWTPVKPTRTPTIDPAKMKITKQDMDESIKLGPGGRPGSFGTWGRGSSGGSKPSAAKEERPANPPGNRYSLLSGGGSNSASDGFERGGASGYRGISGSRGRLSQGRDKGRGGMSRQSQEREKESAIAAARNIATPRSASGNRTPVGSRNQSRESSRNRDRPVSRDQSADKYVAPAPVANELSIPEIESKSKSLLEEYLSVADLKEALLCIKELESPKNFHVCISTILTQVLERSSKARQMASHLLHEGIKKNVVTIDQFTKGLQEVFEFADDMSIDIPQIWVYLGELIGPVVEDSTYPMSTLKTACQPLYPIDKAGLLIAHILNDASHRLGHIKVGALWHQQQMKWSDFLSPKDNLTDFITKYKLEYTLIDEVPKSPEATTMPLMKIQMELEKLLEKAMNEDIFDWVAANVDDHRTREPAFIRVLMTAVCSNAINGQGTNCKVDVERLKKRCILLQRFLDHDAVLELHALYALQALVHKLEHPQEVLRIFFDTLYDEDIVSEDAFYQWEASKDPAEQAGKGVAVTSVVQFFTWLREAEEDPAID